MFTVTFIPTATGERDAAVTISSNDPENSGYMFAIEGTGADQPPPQQSQQRQAVQGPQDSGGAQQAGPAPSGEAEGGGGGDTVTYNGTVTVDLGYISQATDGDWDVLGELRTAFSNYSSLLDSTNLWELYGSASADNKFLYVTVRGYGHGVGLSQRGAQEMANEGKTCADILDFYYNVSANLSHVVTVGTTPKTLAQIPGNSAKTWGKVTATTLKVYAANSTHATVAATLNKGDIVEILGSPSSSWYKILQNSTGVIGCVSASNVTKTTQGPTAAPSIGASAHAHAFRHARALLHAHARDGQGRRGHAHDALPAQFEQHRGVHAREGRFRGDTDAYAADNWYKVRFASYVGYCMASSTTASYIDIIGSAGPAPTPTGTAGPAGPITLTPVKATCNISSGSLTIRKSASKTAGQIFHDDPQGRDVHGAAGELYDNVAGDQLQRRNRLYHEAVRRHIGQLLLSGLHGDDDGKPAQQLQHDLQRLRPAAFGRHARVHRQDLYVLRHVVPGEGRAVYRLHRFALRAAFEELLIQPSPQPLPRSWGRGSFYYGASPQNPYRLIYENLTRKPYDAPSAL